MQEADRKFEEQTLPLILAALHRARHTGKYTEVLIKIPENGGILEIKTTTTEKLK
jgi:hypothetical protein